MPLQGKKPFIRLKPPSDLRPNEELFYCKITHEVFREYEQFFDRVILCNSLVWSCAITGKPGLTFQEAVESEKNARSALKRFPELLKKPLLFLASLTSRGRVNDLYDDVYTFVKQRYFVGEEVDVTLNGVKKTATVTKVVSQENETESQANQEGKVARKPKNVSPEKLKYEVKEKMVGKTAVVKGQCISRVKGVYTKASNKLFLRHNVMSEEGIFKVKPDAVAKHKLESFEFKDAFTGALPKYACSPTKKKPLPPKKKNSLSSPTDSLGKKTNQSKINFKKGTEEDKFITKESQVEFEKRRLILIEQKQKQKDEYKRILEAKKQEAKAQKMKEREKKKEEQKKVAEYLNNWKQLRDDLECDDLKDLPKPVPIKCSIPESCFGDAVAVLEFLNTFSNFLRVRDFFHHGFTFQHLEKALMETDVNGLFNDLLQLLLGPLLNSTHETTGTKSALVNDMTLDPKASGQDMIKLANLAFSWTHKQLGCTLNTLPLDSFSLSEVLRLSILRSGNSKNSNFSRGQDGMTEDPGFDFKKEEPEIINRLATISVFQLNSVERLKVVMLLIHQLNSSDALCSIFDKEFNETLLRLKSNIRSIRFKGPRSDDAADTSKKGEDEAVDQDDSEIKDTTVKIEQTEGDGETKINESGIKNEEEIKQEEEELSMLKAEHERKKHVLKLEMERLQTAFQGALIGRDRGYRRYWLFPTLPGLFVEDDDVNVGPCLAKVTLQLPPNAAAICRADGSAGSIKKYLEESKNGNSDKENDILQDLAIIQNDFSIPLKSRKLSDLNTRVDTKKSVTDGIHEECLQCNEKKEMTDSKCSHLKPTPMYGLCTAHTETCPIHNLESPRTKWSFFYDKQDYQTLLQSLNTRGFRENALRKYLINRKERVLRSLSKCPAMVLNVDMIPTEPRKSQRQIMRKSQFADMKPDIAIEVSLRDMILEMEQKVLDGGLGYLRVPNRKAWVDSIELNAPVTTEDDDKTEDEAADNERRVTVLKELSQAILQISKGVENKYIGPPLMPPKTSSSAAPPPEPHFPIWQESILKCTSLSQLYIHLGVLDRSIIWARSAHNASCRTCRKMGDHEKMLLCDECNQGYHLYCLRPPLKRIPGGDWFCSTCKAREEQPKAKKRPNYKESTDNEDTEEIDSSEEEDEDDDDEEEEDEDNEEEDAEGEEQDEESEEEEGTYVEEVCETCQKPGTVICCDDCPKVYHPECIGLKRIPRGDWSCPECQKKEQNAQRKSQRTSTGRNQSATSTPEEKRSSRRKAEERPKIQIKAAKRKREESSDSETDSAPKKSRRSDSAVNTTRRRSKSSGATDMLDYKTCLDLMVALMHHPSGWPFLVPVSKKDAPDYHQIIKCPMDFGTIKSNLNNMIYKTNDDFLRDVYLVLQNCEFFNPRSSVEYKAGQVINKELKKLLKTHALSHTFTAEMLTALQS